MNLNNESSKKQFIPILLFLTISLLLTGISYLNLFEPFYAITDKITKSVRVNLFKSSFQTDTFASFLLNPASYILANDRLKHQLFDLKSLQVENIKLKEENRALSTQIGSPLQNKKGFILSLIISKNSSLNTINIDKGTRDGITKNSVVVYKNILIGKIVALSSETSQVILEGDNASLIPVIVENSKVNGIVNGSLQYGLVMNEILPDENVTINSNVLTSGLGEVYPKDLLVGTIKSVQAVSSQPFKTAIVNPAINIDDLSYVFILK